MNTVKTDLVKKLDKLVMGGLKKINMNKSTCYLIAKNKNGFTFTLEFFNKDYCSLGSVEVKESNYNLTKEVLNTIYA